jgi:ABC-type phosphate transport system substrate-binding protein
MKKIYGIATIFAIVLICCIVPSPGQSDEFVIVANKDMAGNSISQATIKGIYLREIKSWGNGGGSIIPVDLTSVGSSFYQNLFGKSYVQMQAYWLNMRIKYSVDLPVSKKDPEAVKQFISENKGAIGFLKSGDVDDRVKVLKVN